VIKYPCLACGFDGPHETHVDEDDQLMARCQRCRVIFEIPDDVIIDHKPVANLGLATTGELLDEIRARIEVDYVVGGGGLGYSTAKGRPTSARARTFDPGAQHE
jgi:hypothetical protein